MSNLGILVECTLAFVALRIFFFLFKRFVAHSPLDNVPGPKGSFLGGSITKVFNPKAWGFHRELQKYGSVVRVKGVLGDNLLYIYDPLALHHILVKDQQYFERSNIPVSRLMFGEGLLGTSGVVHRKQRKMLNPVFSAAHMRDMVPLFYNVGHKLEAAFAQKTCKGAQEIDVLSWTTRTALELIAQSGLGSSFDPLTENAVPHPVATATKRVVLVLSKLSILRIYFLPFAVKIGSARFRRTIVENIPSQSIQAAKETVDIMYETATKIYETNRRLLSGGDEALKDHVSHGKDIISILMKNNLMVPKSERLSEQEVLGQMSTLIFAATDTTSTAISRTLWALGQHQDVQDKLRAEIHEAMGDRDSLTYDELVGLKYLDAVCRELLRVYAPVSTISREAHEDMVVPLYTPLQGVNGAILNELLVPKNTKILISVYNSNRNPAIWGPDADEFKPERWLKPLPDAVTGARIPGVYSNLMTFGGGIRSCIGFKFSQLEMKVILSILIRSFKFTLPEDKNIFWTMTGVTVPCVAVGGTPGGPVPSLPLIVEEAK